MKSLLLIGMPGGWEWTVILIILGFAVYRIYQSKSQKFLKIVTLLQLIVMLFMFGLLLNMYQQMILISEKL